MLRRSEPSIVQRLLISNRYLLLRSSAVLVGIRFPQYSAMKAPFLIGEVAKSPRPVFERPMRNTGGDRECLMSTRINRPRRLGNLSIALFPRFMPAGQAHLDEMNKLIASPLAIACCVLVELRRNQQRR